MWLQRGLAVTYAHVAWEYSSHSALNTKKHVQGETRLCVKGISATRTPATDATHAPEVTHGPNKTTGI